MFIKFNKLIGKINSNNTIQITIISLFLILFTVMQLNLAWADGLTSDEPVHIGAGYSYSNGDYWHNYEHPPLINYLSGVFVKFFANPVRLADGSMEQYAFGDDFIFQTNQNSQEIIFYARLPIIILSIVLGIFIYIWAKKLWGFSGGLMSLILFVFSPNIIAHSHLATTDLGSVFFPFISMYLIYLLGIGKINWRSVLWLGVICGLTLSAKFSGALIVPIIVIFFIYFWITKKINFKQLCGYLILLGISSAFVLWSTYILAMYETFSFNPQPYTMLAIFKGAEINKWYTQLIMIPLDYFWQGYIFVKNHSEVGHTAYLNGEISQFGWWYYFPLAFWYKTLLPTIILFFLSLLAIFKKHKKLFVELSIFVLPVVYLIVSLNTKINIGVRHILLLYPFIFLAIGRLATVKFKQKALNVLYIIFVISMLIWAIVESVSYYPSYLAYFNQNAGGGENGYLHLSDSNLDWGQDISRVNDYMLKNDYADYLLLRCEDKSTYDYYQTKSHKIGQPTKDSPKYLAISYFCYQMSINSNDQLFKQIKDKNPIDKIGYSIFIYQVK